jgi:hypothetical protein
MGRACHFLRLQEVELTDQLCTKLPAWFFTCATLAAQAVKRNGKLKL